MPAFLDTLLSANGFIPHGHCYLWKPGLVWLHVVSDLLTALAYYSIPLGLIYFASKRHDFPFPKLLVLFSIFIVACGTTHWMDVWTLWHPVYWLAGAIKAMTAGVSLYTAWVLVAMLPDALAIPSTMQLRATQRAILDAIPDLMVRLNRDGVYLDMLESKETKPLRAKSEVLGHHLTEVLPDEIAQAALHYVEQALVTQSMQVYEYSLTIEGQVQEFESRIVACGADDVVAIIRNISDRKQAETALKQQQELLQTIMDHIPIMVTFFDPMGGFRWVNREWERFTGWSLNDAKTRDMLAEFYPDPCDRQQVVGYIQAAEQTWGDFNTRLRDGTVAETSWANVRLSDGSSIGFGRDVTLERQLERERARLVAILESSPDFVGIADAKGKTLWLNPSAKRLMGYAPDADLSHLTIRDFHPTWANELIQQQGLPEALQSESWTGETALLHRDGSDIAVSQVIIAHRTADGRVDYFSTIMQDIRKRKQAEESLRLSEERYRSLVEATTNSVWVINAEGYNTEIAESWIHLTGQEALEGTAWQWLEPIHPDDRDRVKQTFSHCMATGDLYEIEHRVLGTNGEYRLFLVRGVPVRNADGSIREWVGTLLDITDQRTAETALRQSENTKRAILQAIPDLLIRMRNDGAQLEVVNRGSVRLVMTEEDIIAKRGIFETLPLEVAQGRLHCARLALQTGAVQIHEYELTIDGQRVYEEARVVPLQDDEVLMMVRDISDRKQAELKIQHLNERLEQQNSNLEALVEQRTAELLTFINALPDYIFVVNRDDMRMQFCNDALAHAIGGNSRHDINGKTLFECFSPEIAATFAEQNRIVFESGETLHFQENYELKMGVPHLDTFKIPLKRPNGEVYALIGTSRNITELVEARQALVQQTVQLEQTNRELDSFSYSVSHDLRAPLRHINGFVTALRQQLTQIGAMNDTKVAHYLQIIDDSSQKMGVLTDGLLTLSRVGRRQMEVRPIDLRQLVNTAIALHGCEDDAIQFQISALPVVQGDAALLQQVFSNLIGNAVKFSRDRHPAQIDIGSTADGTIFVRDNGVGFQMEYADQLFGAFQRLHSQHEFEGTGIGLAIVQRIIHRHGGTIWAESQINQGATFYFTLGSE